MRMTSEIILHKISRNINTDTVLFQKLQNKHRKQCNILKLLSTLIERFQQNLWKET